MNLKSMAAELLELPEDYREFALYWHDRLLERGCEVPSSEQLKQAMKRYREKTENHDDSDAH